MKMELEDLRIDLESDISAIKELVMDLEETADNSNLNLIHAISVLADHQISILENWQIS